MRALIIGILAAALILPIGTPALADGEVLVSFAGKVQMQRYEQLSSLRCQNSNAALRLDIATAAPILTLNTNPVETGSQYVAVLDVKGGFCPDSTETFLATKKQDGSWELKDPTLKGVGSIQKETGKTTFVVLIAAKNVTLDQNAFTRIYGTGITQTQLPPIPTLPTAPSVG